MPPIDDLYLLLSEFPASFCSLTYAEVTEPRQEGKWSRLQILGHLCDSAINNLSRFIKMQYEPQPFPLTPYDQNKWMDAQQYGNAAPDDILNLWVSLNQTVLRVISNLTPAQLSLVVQFPQGDTVTLEWLIEDYIQHMKHHLGQIFPQNAS